ncbi:MAG TPA: YihY/virulence factor BrkB family protein [Fimbriimonas sp.]|nr:YihY/virulence factor BrkB family protein [Fimbriimonas sp.]
MGADNLPRLASSFSFFALLSMAPLLVLAVTIGSYFVGKEQVSTEIQRQAKAFGGLQMAEFIRTLIVSSQQRTTGLVAGMVSLGVTFFSASSLFLQINAAIEVIWKIKVDGPFIRNFIVSRLLAFISVVFFGAGLVGWIVLDSVVSLFAWQAISFVVSVLFLTVAFAINFRVLPKTNVCWGDVWVGGFVTGLGFSISKLLFATYVGKASSVYSAAGGVIVLLLWLYYSSMIYFFGIELTYMYAHRFGSLKGKKEPVLPIGENQIPKEQLS